MNNEYPTFLHQWFERVWNLKQTQAIEELAAPDVVAHGLTDANGEVVQGTDNFKAFHAAFCSAYPDMNIEILDTITDGDKIAARCRVTGVHSGDGLGLMATNNPVDFTGMSIVRVEDGKIAEAWNEFDFVKMFGQLGVLHHPLQLEKNKETVRRWFENVWNNKDPELIDVIMSDDTIHHGVAGAPGGQLKGRAAFREFWNVMLTAFPDINFEIKEVIADGNKVGARYVATGTHSGPFPGFEEPTGRRVEFTGGGMCSIDAEGRFDNVWNEIDFSKMYADLSAADPSGQ